MSGYIFGHCVGLWQCCISSVFKAWIPINTNLKQSFFISLVCLDMDVEIIILNTGNIQCYDLESKTKKKLKKCVCADPLYEELVKPMS